MRNINPFGLRMQPELRAKLEEAARASGRSLNAEITHHLEQAMEVAGTSYATPSASNLIKIIGELAHQVRALSEEIKELKESNPDSK